MSKVLNDFGLKVSLTDEELKGRKDFIGSSEVAAILNMSDYANAANVMLSKLGVNNYTSSKAAETGSICELSLVKEGARQVSRRLQTAELTLEHNVIKTHDNGFFRCELDGWIPEISEHIEAKTAGLENPNFVNTEWGKPFDFKKMSQVNDLIPKSYMFQIQFAMMCAKTEFVNVSALIGAGAGRRYYYIKRNYELCDFIEERLIEFWETVKRIKGEYESGELKLSDVSKSHNYGEPLKKEKLRSVIRRLPEREPRKIVTIDNGLAVRWSALKDQESLVSESIESLKDEVTEVMQDGEIGKTDLGNFEYKLRKDNTRHFVFKESEA